MKKIYLLLFTLSSLTLTFGQNELSNHSFETWTGTGSLDTPTDWYGSKSSIAKSDVIQSTDANDGASSVALSSSTSSHKRFTNEAITANNEEYTLTYFAKGDGDLRNAYHDGAYSTYGSYTSLTSASGWVQMTYVFTPNAGSLEVIFSLRNTTGNGILIDNVVLVKSSTLSTQTVEKEQFSIYPNPVTNGIVNIKTTSNTVVEAAVFNVLGKQVLSSTVNNNTLDVSNLNSGIYILQLNQNGTSTTKKLVIK